MEIPSIVPVTMRPLIPNLILAFLVSSTAMAQAPRVVTLGGDPWPPYVLGTLGKEATGGIGIDLMKEIFARLDGVDVAFPLVPWQRALQEVEQGTMDGIGILLKTPEREQFMNYTDELFTSRDLVWYSTKRFPDRFDWERIEDLSSHNIGIIRGHSYGSKIDALIESNSIKTTPITSVQLMFTMLARGRVDLVFANNAVGYAAVKEVAQSDIEILAARNPISVDVYHIGLSKKSSARKLVPAINRIISALKNEGIVERIIHSGTSAE